MEKLTISKDKALQYYNAASADTQEVLREMFGAEAFAFDFRSIKTYADACHHLGMREHLLTGDPDGDREAQAQADAVYKLIVICKALNNGQPYDEDGTTWFPAYLFYSKQKLKEMGEQERKRKGIKLLSAALASYSGHAGVRCACAGYRGANTTAHYGFPLVLNSEEKALYVAKQFEDLIFACYGIKVKQED
jgi:hypothetical protein